ncbi:hypothetical protein ABZ468_07885 [Streptomyces sp. NPDC005708]|uniref:hypothetical protein n=1 Tax=Streptomyces sp. NPDC005708 TaxID=3154564 RepID=UPI0033E4B17D
MSFVIDLDAERREVQYPNGIPVRFRGEQFMFPAELPADALDPILSEDLDLFGLFAEAITSSAGDAGIKEITNALFRRPDLPVKFLRAVRETYAILLEDQTEDFLKRKPSVPDYVRLTIALIKVYGVDLGKLFRSDDSSETASATSSPTSPASTESTPDASGSDPDTATTSGSAG